MLIFIVFGLLLPLILLIILTALACFIVGRPRAGLFFVFLDLDLFRRFAYFLSQVAYTSPHESVVYSLLSSDLGFGIIWGCMLGSLAWSWYDQYRSLGGLRKLKQSVKETRQTYRASNEGRKDVLKS